MTNKGYNAMTGLYTTRYYARKACPGDCVVVKVCGGYTIMTAADYNICASSVDQTQPKMAKIFLASPVNGACSVV